MDSVNDTNTNDTNDTNDDAVAIDTSNVTNDVVNDGDIVNVAVDNDIVSASKDVSDTDNEISSQLTSEQSIILTQLKTTCPPHYLATSKLNIESVDHVCLRFLRARQFDMAKTLELLKEAHNTKQLYRIPEIISRSEHENARCDVSILKNWYPHSMPGFDKFNRPILFEHSGGITPPVLSILTTREYMIDYHFWVMEIALNQMMEVAKERSERLGLPLMFSTCVVMDFAGLNSAHCSAKMLDHVKSLVQIDNICYPELLGKLLVINAPWITVGLWNMIKGWLDPRTQAKIEILSPGQDSMNRLLHYIDRDQLPVAYGGTGADFYTPRNDVENVTVPRQGHWRKVMHVPAGRVLTVDSYVGDGIVEFVVACVDTLEPQHHHGMSKSASATSAASKQHAASSSGSGQYTHGTCLFKKVLSGDGTKPDRCLYHCPTAEQDRIIVLSWNNSSRFSTRNIVFAAVIENPQRLDAASDIAVDIKTRLTVSDSK